MATRAIKPKREDTLLSGWQSRPERAPSVVRPDQPMFARVLALVSLGLVVIGLLGILARADNALRLLAWIGQGRGLFFFTLGIAVRAGFGATDAAFLARARLGDAMADEVDRVEPRHVLLLEEVGGVALALGKDGDEHIGARNLFLA